MCSIIPHQKVNVNRFFTFFKNKMTCINIITLFSQGLMFCQIAVCLLYNTTREVHTMKAEYKQLYENLGLNIVYYRKKNRLTQLQLAELVDIDRSHISAIELGNVGCSLDVIFRLCDVLDITPKVLFDFRD